MKKITLKIEKPLLGKAVGEQVSLDVDRDGIIIDRYWRRRLQDSELDKCVSIVKKSTTKPKATGA